MKQKTKREVKKILRETFKLFEVSMPDDTHSELSEHIMVMLSIYFKDL